MLKELSRVEDISQVVATGEIATLWTVEEKTELQDTMNVLAKAKVSFSYFYSTLIRLL
jgi:hypothetical protein